MAPILPTSMSWSCHFLGDFRNCFYGFHFHFAGPHTTTTHLCAHIDFHSNGINQRRRRPGASGEPRCGQKLRFKVLNVKIELSSVALANGMCGWKEKWQAQQCCHSQCHIQRDYIACAQQIRRRKRFQIKFCGKTTEKWPTGAKKLRSKAICCIKPILAIHDECMAASHNESNDISSCVSSRRPLKAIWFDGGKVSSQALIPRQVQREKHWKMCFSATLFLHLSWVCPAPGHSAHKMWLANSSFEANNSRTLSPKNV